MREQSAIILWLWICYCFSYLSHLSFVFHFFQPSLVWTLFLNSFYLPSYILGIKLLLLLWLQSMGLQKLDMTQPSATKQQHTALGCHKASFLSFFFFLTVVYFHFFLQIFCDILAIYTISFKNINFTLNFQLSIRN